MWDALRPELLRWVGAIGRAFPRNHLPAQGQLRRLPTLFLVDERRHSGLGAAKVVLGFLLLLARGERPHRLDVLLGARHHLGDLGVADLTGRARARFVQKTIQAMLGKPSSPFADRVRDCAHAQADRSSQEPWASACD